MYVSFYLYLPPTHNRLWVPLLISVTLLVDDLSIIVLLVVISIAVGAHGAGFNQDSKQFPLTGCLEVSF